FSFLDVADAIVKQRKTSPADLIVRAELDSFLSRFGRLRKTPQFHQRHAECVPAVEEIGRHLNAPPIFCHSAFQVADSEVAVRIVKDLIMCRHLKHQISKKSPIALEN